MKKMEVEMRIDLEKLVKDHEKLSTSFNDMKR